MIDPNIENVLLILILVIGFMARLPYNKFPEDPDKFYKAIKQLVLNEGLRTKTGKNGKSRAKEYSWNKIMEKYRAVLK